MDWLNLYYFNYNLAVIYDIKQVPNYQQTNLKNILMNQLFIKFLINLGFQFNAQINMSLFQVTL